MANLAPMIGEFAGVETAPISIEGNGKSWSVSAGNFVDQSLEGASGLGGEQLYSRRHRPPGQYAAGPGECEEEPRSRIRHRLGPGRRPQQRPLRPLRLARVTAPVTHEATCSQLPGNVNSLSVRSSRAGGHSSTLPPLRPHIRPARPPLANSGANRWDDPDRHQPRQHHPPRRFPTVALLENTSDLHRPLLCGDYGRHLKCEEARR